MRTLLALLTAAALAGAAQPAGAQSEDAPAGDPDPAPEGVDILMPRGGIPAVFAPVFVPGEDANLPDDAWVLGFASGGEAHAYSLNLLNNHEVVNDVVGGHPIAAVW